MAEAASPTHAPGEPLFAGADTRADRILNAKLRVLYQGVFAIPANLAVAGVVVLLLSGTFPAPLLVVWCIAMVALSGLRWRLHRLFMRAALQGSGGTRWGTYFATGSLASGALWGALCLALPLHGTPENYVVMTLTAAGMTAGALTTIASYYPAFVLYTCSFTWPLAIVSIMSPLPHIAANGWLVLLYTALICAAGKKLDKDISRTIELQVDNAALNESLLRTRVERDTARSEKWSTISHLSHELRTPLNAILGFSETMHGKLFGPLGNARYDEYIGHVYSSGKRLLRLVDELLQLSQGEAGKLTLVEDVVDVRAIVDDCLRHLSVTAENAKVSLTNALPRDLPPLHADEAKLRQIVFNLADNAIKFTPQQGTVTVAGGISDSGGFSLVVADTGIGMAPEDVALALQPFGRIASPLTHGTEGIGLGLPVSLRLAELHGAKFSIQSAPGQGTTCMIAFPPARIAKAVPHTPAIDAKAASAA